MWIKFGGLAVRVETAILKSANIIFAATCNNVMHAVVLLVPPGAHLRKPHQHTASYISCKILQIYGFVQVFQARGRQRFLIHVCNVHDDIICCKAPLPNLNFTNIFLRSAWGQTAACQYFWLCIHYRLHKVEGTGRPWGRNVYRVPLV